MRKNIILCLSLLFVSIGSFAQELKPSYFLKPNKYEHDFGVIKQENGEVYYTFKLQNISSGNVMINSANPECSCTEPTWTNESIKPNEFGEIKVGYKADVYPGSFTKKITVYTNVDTFDLRIHGKVTPKPLTEVEKEYAYNVGALRFKKDDFAMNTIYDNAPKSIEFLVYNDSSKAINKLKFENVPSYITIVAPEVIASKAQEKIVVTFDPIKFNDYGYTIDYVKLNVGKNSKEFSIMANVSPFIPTYSLADLTNAPKLKMDSLKAFDFKVIKKDSVYTKKVLIQNIGATDLKILKIKPACTCITTDLNEKLILKPNQSRVVTIYFDTHGRTGTTKKNIYFYSSDPLDPAHVYKISADIR